MFLMNLEILVQYHRMLQLLLAQMYQCSQSLGILYVHLKYMNQIKFIDLSDDSVNF